jgi:copper chaperone CopZ
VNKRILVPLALLVLAALTITACGGGESDESKITEVIEKAATTTDPSNCSELETQRFNEQNTQQKGKAATKACEEEAKAGEEQAEGAKVSNVSVNGEKATAEVEFEGGSLGSQTLEVALVQEGGNWKLDQVEGFANYNGKALGEAFEKEFEEKPEGLSKKQAACIAGKVAGSSQKEAEELFFSGSSEPIIKLAEGCA